MSEKELEGINRLFNGKEDDIRLAVQILQLNKYSTRDIMIMFNLLNGITEPPDHIRGEDSQEFSNQCIVNWRYMTLWKGDEDEHNPNRSESSIFVSMKNETTEDFHIRIT